MRFQDLATYGSFVMLMAHPLSHAQTTATPASLAIAKARSLYYTPVDQGLKGFQCVVTFDWKGFIQEARHQAVPDNDERLQYLRSIQLSVEDELRGQGSLRWEAPSPPSDQDQDAISKIREGLQQIWSGFFQSWNGFLTGDLLTPDPRSTLESSLDGYTLSLRNGQNLAEETFNNQLVLQRVHVVTPSLDSSILPTFSHSSQGLLVTGIASSNRQPPSAPPTDLKMDINYGLVNTFEIPSSLHVAVGPAQFAFALSNCTTQSR